MNPTYVTAMMMLLFLFVPCEGRGEGAPVEKSIKLDGTLNYIEAQTLSALPDEVEYFAISKGEVSSVLEVISTLPPGAKLKVYSAKYEKSLEETKKRGKFYELTLQSEADMKERQKKCLPIGVESEDELKDDKEVMLNPKDFPPIDDPRCHLFTHKELEDMATSFSQTYGGKWSIGNICAYLVKIMGEVDFSGTNPFLTPTPTVLPIPTVTPAPAVITSKVEAAPTPSSVKRVRAFSLLRKDTCDTTTKKYVVKISLNLKPAKKRALPQSRAVLIVRANEFSSAPRACALKPQSEGRFAPRPIFLMNWMGSTCGNEINVTKWSREKPLWSGTTSPYSLFLYKGIILSASLADGVLRGGKGTVTLSNGYEAYSTCFDLARRRQNKNNYPR